MFSMIWISDFFSMNIAKAVSGSVLKTGYELKTDSSSHENSSGSFEYSSRRNLSAFERTSGDLSLIRSLNFLMSILMSLFFSFDKPLQTFKRTDADLSLMRPGTFSQMSLIKLSALYSLALISLMHVKTVKMNLETTSRISSHVSFDLLITSMKYSSVCLLSFWRISDLAKRFTACFLWFTFADPRSPLIDW